MTVRCANLGLIAALTLTGLLVLNPDSAAAAGCTTSGKASHHGVELNGKCIEGGKDGDATPAPPTKMIFCGRPSSDENALWNEQCGPPRACFARDKTTGRRIPADAFATLTRVGGRWTNPVVWCPKDAQPAVTMTAIRDRAIRLVPHVKIGSAWTTSTLVNVETVLWAATATDRTLGTVTILGQSVRLRISFERADWDFGDDDTATATTPGKAYDGKLDPCRTPQCASYYGHTYARTGQMTITLAVTWHAEFSLDGTTWTGIDEPITGPTDEHPIAVKQARGILVPNPDGH